jgi:hypothetical protein
VLGSMYNDMEKQLPVQPLEETSSPAS